MAVTMAQAATWAVASASTSPPSRASFTFAMAAGVAAVAPAQLERAAPAVPVPPR